jgi:hypothetical protein
MCKKDRKKWRDSTHPTTQLVSWKVLNCFRVIYATLLRDVDVGDGCCWRSPLRPAQRPPAGCVLRIVSLFLWARPADYGFVPRSSVCDWSLVGFDFARIMSLPSDNQPTTERTFDR